MCAWAWKKIISDISHKIDKESSWNDCDKNKLGIYVSFSGTIILSGFDKWLGIHLLDLFSFHLSIDCFTLLLCKEKSKKITSYLHSWTHAHAPKNKKIFESINREIYDIEIASNFREAIKCSFAYNNFSLRFLRKLSECKLHFNVRQMRNNKNFAKFNFIFIYINANKWWFTEPPSQKQGAVHATTISSFWKRVYE